MRAELTTCLVLPTAAGKRLAERSAAKPDAEKPFGDFEVFKSDESKRPSKPKADVAKPKPHSGVKLHGGEKAILKALKQKTSLEFVETPLKDVLDYLSEKHRIPIQMDPSGLKDVGVRRGTQVTCSSPASPCVRPWRSCSTSFSSSGASIMTCS